MDHEFSKGRDIFKLASENKLFFSFKYAILKNHRVIANFSYLDSKECMGFMCGI